MRGGRRRWSMRVMGMMGCMLKGSWLDNGFESGVLG